MPALASLAEFRQAVADFRKKRPMLLEGMKSQLITVGDPRP